MCVLQQKTKTKTKQTNLITIKADVYIFDKIFLVDKKDLKIDYLACFYYTYITLSCYGQQSEHVKSVKMGVLNRVNGSYSAFLF